MIVTNYTENNSIFEQYVNPAATENMMDRNRSRFIPSATLLLVVCMILTLHDMNRFDFIRMIIPNIMLFPVVNAQLTCDVSKNKKVLLYYNASKGMYVPYDIPYVVDDTSTSTTSMTNDTNTRRQTRRRNAGRRMNHILQDHIRNNHHESSERDGLVQRLINLFVGDDDDDDDDEYNDGDFDINHEFVSSESAIKIINPNTLSNHDSNNDDWNSRNLAATLGSLRNRDNDGVNDISPNIKLIEPTDGTIIEVRPCHCVYSWNDQSPTFYCPINKRNCFVPQMASSSTTSSNYANHPVCLNAPSPRWYFAKYLKLLGTVSSILIIVVLCVSPHGRHAIRFCCKPFGCNQRYIHQVTEKKSDERRQLLQRYMKVREDQYTKRFQELQRIHGEIDGNDNTNDSTTSDTTTQQKPKVVPLNEIDESIIHDIFYYRPSLLLKTRIYETKKVSSTSMNDQNELLETTPVQVINDGTFNAYDTTTLMNDTDMSVHDQNENNDNNNTKKEDGCMICFNTFEDGCKVGVLPHCTHTFHSKCLKDWLKRRNVCPLCLESDVATTAFSHKTLRSTLTTTTNNNSTDTDDTFR
jgi:hypothetical protein